MDHRNRKQTNESMQNDNPHRKHAWWCDYKERGIYMITIVVRNRKRLFGELNMDAQNPAVNLTPLGQAVQKEWLNTADIQRLKKRKIRLLGSAVMPDHFHGILFVEERMDVGLGEVIRGFKTACTQARNRLLRDCQPSLADSTTHPNLADSTTHPSLADGITYPNLADSTGQTDLTEQRKMLARMSHKQREAYYDTLPERQPLFADNYDDTICFHKGQLDNIIRYVHDNPRRAVLKRLSPQLFRLHQQVQVAGFCCNTLGNQFLMDYPQKAILQCSRRLRQEDIDHKKEQCLADAEMGTVFVSGGISEGEKQICKALRETSFPLIILLKEGFPQPDNPHYKYFKPQGVYFEACAAGRLLLIEPSEEFYESKYIEQQVYVKTGPIQHNTMRYRFLALNALAEKIAE